jgi:50S ribosomal subunit-associated GTPase HflX
VQAYSPALAAKPHVVVLTKRDLLPGDAALPRIEAPGALGRYVISSAAHDGLEALVEALWDQVSALRAAEESDAGESGGEPAWEAEAGDAGP